MKNRTCLSVLFVVISGLVSNYCPAQLNGINTINPAIANFTANPGGVAGRNYSSFNNAVSALTQYGISGPVVFDVAAGTYNEQLTIGLIKGASNIRTIRFHAANNDSTSVIISYATPISVINYVIRLSNARHIILSNMTIMATGSNGGNVIELGSNADSNIISGNLISTLKSSSSMYNGIYSSNANTHNNLIENNLISGGYAGVYMYGSSAANNIPEIIIEKNFFRDFYYSGIYLRGANSCIIRKNDIENFTSSGSAYGIYVYSCSYKTRISANFIRLKSPANNTGIDLEYSNPSDTSFGEISNNFISIGNSLANNTGINMANSSYFNVDFNSICLYSGTVSDKAININSSSPKSFNIRNNIFSSFSSGFAISVNSLTILNVSDRNDLYSNGPYVVSCNGNKDLAGWQTYSGQDKNSMRVDPGFYSFADLHINTASLNNKASIVSGITEDIDGDIRSSTPDIGADEFIPIANDAAVTELASPVTGCMGVDTVKVKIKNVGSALLSNVRLNWMINGVLQTPLNLVLSLAQNQVSVITTGTLLFSSGSAYNLKFWTSLPNNLPDGKTANDTLTINGLLTAMNGVYSIGLNSSDYHSFNEAGSDLIRRGVCGPVIFRVKAGNYHEQLLIPNIKGSSSVNTITFESESADSSSVDLNYAAIAAADNYVVKLDAACFIRFNRIQIRATGYNYANAVVLNAAASYNIFSGNIIMSVTGTNYSSYSGCLTETYSSTGNFNIIKNNYLNGGYYGIFLVGITTSSMGTGNVMKANRINDYKKAGIYLLYQASPVINDNFITSQNGIDGSYGIYTAYCYDSMRILNNKIYLNYLDKNSSANGLFNSISVAKSQTMSLIANNMISIYGASAVVNYGIYESSSQYMNILFNSVAIYTGSTSGTAFYGNSGLNITLKNNIFANIGGGYAYYINSTSAISASDYNDLYTSGTQLAYWNGYRANLAALKSASSKDTKSVSADPFFCTVSDLHAVSHAVDSAGQYNTLVKTDIDHENRNLNYPDMGADEFRIYRRDAAILSLAGKFAPCPSVAGNLKIVFRNMGTDTIKTARISILLNGIALPDFTFNGHLAFFKDSIITIAAFTLNPGSTNEVKIRINNVNGVADENPKNDTFTQKGLKPALSGIFTIGKSGRDYPTFTDAVNDLVANGVCSAVTFVADTGSYNEQLYIPAISGSSSSNTVTFTSASGDSSTVILFSDSKTGNRIITLDGADFICFQKMTIQSVLTDVTFDNIILENGADYSIFRNNVIRSANRSSRDININNSTVSNYNIIENNLISGGNYGIYNSGYTNHTKGTVIRHNQFEGFYTGLLLNYQDSIIIDGNILHSINLSYGLIAIYLNYPGNHCQVTNNQINLNGYDMEGIQIYYYNGSASATALIANNFITLNGTTGNIAFGIYCYNCNWVNFFHNSINISGGTDKRSSGFFFSRSNSGAYGNIYCENNIVLNTAAGCAINIDSLSMLAPQYLKVSDYNNFHVSSPAIGMIGSRDVFDIKSWQFLTNYDLHSTTKLAPFVSDSDLHLKNYGVSKVFFSVLNPLKEVATDIDGDQRNLSRPVIGADEMQSVPVDACILDIVSPATNNCEGALPVSAKVFNLGYLPIDSVYVDYYLNGTKKKTVLIRNLGAFLSDSTIYFGSENFSHSNNYNLVFKARLANTHLIDKHPENDADSLFHPKFFELPSIKSVSSDTACKGSVATLKVYSDNSRIFYWYDSATGGNILSVDSVFKTSSLSKNRTYYVEAGTPGSPYNFSTSARMSTVEMGNMFNIKATATDIIIDSFAVQSSLPSGSLFTVAVYYKRGSWKGFESKPSAWKLAGYDTVQSAGQSVFSDISVGNVPITKNDSVSFYVTTTDPFMLLYNSEGAKNMYDPMLKISTGTKNFYSFDPFFENDFSWNGRVYYSSGSICHSARTPVNAFSRHIPTVAFSINDSFQCLKNNHFVFTNHSYDSLSTITDNYWEFGDGSSMNFTNAFHDYSSASIFPVKLKVTSGTGCTDSIYRYAYVFKPSVNLGKDTSIYSNQSIDLDAGSGGEKYHWSNGDTIQKIHLDTNGYGLGKKLFWVNVIQYGCSAADSIYITFLKGVSIGETGHETVLLFPNPAHNMLNLIVPPLAKPAEMKISTAGGKVVYKAHLNAGSGPLLKQINLSDFSDGIYLFTLYNEDFCITKKVIRN